MNSDGGNQRPPRTAGKRLEIRKELIKKLSRDELDRVQGGTIGCCEYWCGHSCRPITWDRVHDILN
jgi:hypothetical protein